jgi:hypothetical protein
MGLQEDLKKEFVQNYLAQDGLCRLTEEFRTLPDGTTSVINDNGILFAVSGYALLDKLGLLDGADSIRFLHTVSNLAVEPGLYNRRSDATERTEAHDNYAGIAVGSVIFDKWFARDICEYGERKGWQFANVTPNTFQFSQLRQGGEIALYKICAGRVPYLTEWAWCLGGMLWTSFKGTPSTLNLFYLRSYGITKALKRYADGASSLWWPITLSWKIAAPIITGLADKHFGGLKTTTAQYFGPDHVISRLAAIA